MTDEEINKRVAEIEGLRPLDRPGPCIIPDWWLRPDKVVGDCDLMLGCLYEPATDWAWLGPVLEKAISKYGKGFMKIVYVFMYDEDRPLKQAICLAWIAAHEKT